MQKEKGIVMFNELRVSKKLICKSNDLVFSEYF